MMNLRAAFWQTAHSPVYNDRSIVSHIKIQQASIHFVSIMLSRVRLGILSLEVTSLKYKRDRRKITPPPLSAYP
jgi:hypothetical protein